jgi:hypothetical protein
MIQFTALDPRVTADHVGIIPMFLSPDDPAPAREQFDKNYAHGGGWHSMSGWTLNDDLSLQYSDKEGSDPPLKPYAKAKFRDELIVIYPYAWVVIQQQDGSFEVSRMD